MLKIKNSKPYIQPQMLAMFAMTKYNFVKEQQNALLFTSHANLTKCQETLKSELLTLAMETLTVPIRLTEGFFQICNIHEACILKDDPIVHA